MKEKVGECMKCQKEIYCLDGFLNGVVLDNGDVVCFDCDDDCTKTEEQS
jgi:hypothetical protein